MSEALFLLFANLVQISPGDVGIKKVSLTDATIADGLAATFVVVGAMGTLFLLVGAARYVTSNGEQSQIAQAKNTILFAVIGMVVATLGFTIVQFVLGKVG